MHRYAASTFDGGTGERSGDGMTNLSPDASNPLTVSRVRHGANTDTGHNYIITA